ncbi:MAG: epimerase [Clostridia bacterium]|nr:epimerase [Clostridia bacterium]
MRKKVIITGTTGMVGKAVLLECLEDDRIESVLIINRRSINMTHPKLKEIIHENFLNLETLKTDLYGYDACFFCMGVSVIGLNEEEYTRITYSITEIFASTLYNINPKMVFNYVSGAGTDSTEKSRVMWARVKGRTENMVLNKGFKDAYSVRLGAILPEKGIKSKTNWYNIFYIIFRPFFPIMKRMKSITTTTKFGKAMINTIYNPRDLKHLENKHINELAGKL